MIEHYHSILSFNSLTVNLPCPLISQIRPTDPPALKRKFSKVQAIVDKELDFCAGKDTPRTGYLYIRNRRVVGMLLAEPIRRAHPLQNSNQSTPRKAALGVYQLWVHANFRQQKIASQLVTTAREKMVFGWVVPVAEVAFSSPTQAGMAFAQRYTQGSEVLVYDCGMKGRDD